MSTTTIPHALQAATFRITNVALELAGIGCVTTARRAINLEELGASARASPAHSYSAVEPAKTNRIPRETTINRKNRAISPRAWPIGEKITSISMQALAGGISRHVAARSPYQ